MDPCRTESVKKQIILIKKLSKKYQGFPMFETFKWFVPQNIIFIVVENLLLFINTKNK